MRFKVEYANEFYQIYVEMRCDLEPSGSTSLRKGGEKIGNVLFIRRKGKEIQPLGYKTTSRSCHLCRPDNRKTA